MKKIILALLCYSICTMLSAQMVKWCIYDPMGGRGPFAHILQDYQLTAQTWSMQLRPLFYQTEAAALHAFDQGQCDVVVASSYQTKHYNAFMGTLGAVGVIQDSKVVSSLLKQMPHPKLSPYLASREYQVLGMLPIGFAYLIAEDGKRRKLTDLVNAKLGVIENDIVQIQMAKRIGAQPVPIRFDNVSAKLLAKQIDVVPLPIMAFEAFQLQHKLSLQPHSIVNFPVVFIGLNIIARQSQVTPAQAHASRQWFAQQADRLVNQMLRAEHQLPAQYWLDLSRQDWQAYERLLLKMRQEYAQQGIYHPVFIDLMTKFRCLHQPQGVGCS